MIFQSLVRSKLVFSCLVLFKLLWTFWMFFLISKYKKLWLERTKFNAHYKVLNAILVLMTFASLDWCACCTDLVIFRALQTFTSSLSRFMFENFIFLRPTGFLFERSLSQEKNNFIGEDLWRTDFTHIAERNFLFQIFYKAKVAYDMTVHVSIILIGCIDRASILRWNSEINAYND